MKRLSIQHLFTILVLATVFLGACNKENNGVRYAPKLSTSQLLNVKSDSATIVGFVIAEGDGVIERGVVYATSPSPTTANTKVILSAVPTGATFTVKVGGLAYATTYYARAYITTAAGTVYGEQVTFTTLPVVPTLTTTAITGITGNAAAGGGNVTISGGASVTARGIVFGVNHNPTLSDSKTSDGTGTGAFTSALASLKGNTTYYVRAYATNSAGTGYGPEASFKTLVDLPVVTTTAVSAITKTTAISGGNVTYDGGGTITARGLAWGATANPTISGNIIAGGTGTGLFVSNMSGLTVNSTYHVRAYATNSAGTAYGADLSFTTLADITKFWLVGSYNGWSNSDNALYIISTTSSAGMAEGFAYLTTDALKFTTDHSWDDAHTFGDGGSGKLTNPGNNISIASNGYYQVKASQSAMTYSLIKTVWGVIGDATAGGWGSQTDMNYNADTKKFFLGAHLTNASIKFRGTSDWSINFGSDAADGTLGYGAANIPVSLEADYAITLDLSQPNAYTYSINRWGVIGDATPGGWGTDTNMTWDAVNNVMTVTMTLTSGGSFKFRANDDWAINYGGSLTGLTAGGDNIPVTSTGSYKITLDLNKAVPTATVTKL